jgi:cytoskeleton-associated protein 5
VLVPTKTSLSVFLLCCCCCLQQTIDLRGLLLSLHAFFEALGVEEIRRRSHADDKPLRMVKTILHELCKLKGTEIYK